MRDTRARDGTAACEGCARAVSEVRRVKTRGATGVWDPRTARIRRRFSRRARTRRTVAARRFETRSFKGCLKTRTVCPSRTVALGGGLKRACGDRARGGEAGEPPSPRVPSTVLDRARRARVGAAAGATAVARLEERRATRDCAGQATPRALAANMLLTSSAFSSGCACRVAGRDDGKSVARVHERDTKRVLPEATRRGRGGARRSVLWRNRTRNIAAACAPIRSGKRFLKFIFLTARHRQILRRFC